MPPKRSQTQELLNAIFDDLDQPIARQVAGWLAESSRFREFALRYQQKMRRKVRLSQDDETRRDLICEFAIAYHLLQERRFAVVYEAGGTGKQREPDFTVSEGANIHFGVEVRRMRGAPPPQPDLASQDRQRRLLNIICDKLTQMPNSGSNVLVIVQDEHGVDEANILASTRELKRHAEQKDEAFFQQRKLGSTREFFTYWPRLSAILMLSSPLAVPQGIIWLNKETRHPLPSSTLAALTRLFNL